MDHRSQPRQLETEIWPPPEFDPFRDEKGTEEDWAVLWKALLKRQPRALTAIIEDARIFAGYRNEPVPKDSTVSKLATVVRLSWRSDAFFSLVCYRVRMSMLRRRIPVLPTILHKLSIATGQVSIGETVVIEAGIYIPHGQVIVDGLTQIGSGAVLAPWVAIGTEIGHWVGPDIGRRAYFGTGAKMLGPIRVGSGAQVAANSVVVSDVPSDTTVAGAPARVIGRARSAMKAVR